MPNKQRAQTRITSPDEINTHRMAKPAIEALLFGMDAGWDVTQMRNGALRLAREHDGRQVQILIPTDQPSIRESVSRKWIKKIITYGDEMKLEMMRQAYNDLDSPLATEEEKMAAEVVIRGLNSSRIRRDPSMLLREIKAENGQALADLVNDDDVTVTEFADTIGAPEDVKARVAEFEAQRSVPNPEPGDDDQSVPHIVKVRPWKAKHSITTGGAARTYESKAVLERKWSDGSMDYQCTRCEYTNPNSRSVTSHYGQAHPEAPATVTYEEVMKDPAAHWTPTERQQGRIRRLANEMQQAQQEIGENMTAFECAEWIVKHRDAARDGHLDDESTPLDDAAIISRIRNLVDRGAYADLLARIDDVQVKAAAQVAQVEARCAEMQTEIARHDLGARNGLAALENRLRETEAAQHAAEQDAEEARAAAKEATERWQTLKDLINQ